MPSDLLEAYILCLGFAKLAFCSYLMVNYMRIFRVDCIFWAKCVARKNFVLDTRLRFVVINHMSHILVTYYQSSLHSTE